MECVRCEVLSEFNGNEEHVGFIEVYFIPRVGEYIWFSEEINGFSSWVVEDVCYHVGNGKEGNYPLGYQSVVIYASPTNK